MSEEEAETVQAQGQMLFSEQACGHLYGVTKASVQAVQYQDKVGPTTTHNTTPDHTMLHHTTPHYTTHTIPVRFCGC